jgi:hypothetical protein
MLHFLRFRRIGLLLCAGLAMTAPRLAAAVVRVDIATRAPLGTSGYEKIVGVAHFAVDPRDPRNAVIADLDKAPVNAAGNVEFAADLYILRPVDAATSNGIAFIDVLNRGRKIILNGFNRGAVNDPMTDADLGDAFLMHQGYTLVWVGWQFDVRRQGGMLGLDVPAARGLAGLVRAEFTPNTRTTQQTVTDLEGYRPANPDAADTTLTVRSGPFGTPAPIPHGQFTLKENTLTVPGGFEPGKTYELAYHPEAMPIAGLGMAAFRDVTAWIKHAPDAPAGTPRAIAFGSSQSGRFLRTFLYYGFNTDEQGGQVLDGVMVHIAGAARLSLNERGATPNALSMFVATAFPFATVATRDPLSGKREGLLDNDRARQNQPKVFFTNTAVEYWGGGRSAALIHTTPDATTDLPMPDNTRVYFLTGAQHSPAKFPTHVGQGQQPDNPVEYWWTLRALLVGMTRWVKEGTPPPVSQYPHLADGTLVPVAKIAFPVLAGVQAPGIVPPARHGGKALPFFVPQVDADGNERSGIRSAEIRVPVATYTGWNFRNPSIGGTDQLVSLLGSAIPFSKTKAEREAAHDPRPSLAERYASREAYVASAQAIADALVKGGYLLADDVSQVMARIDAQWR